LSTELETHLILRNTGSFFLALCWDIMHSVY